MTLTPRGRFEGTKSYVATDDLKVAVNASITLERPLLVKGEPGTGKTVLALEVAKALGAPILEWHIKSTTKAQQGLYEYDAVARLRDGQLGDERVHDIRNYIKRGKLWEAFLMDERPVRDCDSGALSAWLRRHPAPPKTGRRAGKASSGESGNSG
jgi:MoxR-like ATPase